MTPPTRWWWVRHAPVTVNNGCIYGQTDLPCDCGPAEAFAWLAARLPRDAVWVTSHLQRTHLTAAAIVRAGLAGPDLIPGPAVVVERDLAEQHFGTWQGLSYGALPGLLGAAYSRLWLAPAHHTPPGGESFLDVAARVRGAIDRLGSRFAGRDIIAVAHGGTIRAALAHAAGIAPEAALAFAIDNCSLTTFEHHADEGREGWRIVAVNQLWH